MFEFIPTTISDRKFIMEREYNWTPKGFILPSGKVIADPFPGMVWISINGALKATKNPDLIAMN